MHRPIFSVLYGSVLTLALIAAFAALTMDLMDFVETADSNSSVSTACDDGNACTVDFLDTSDDTCTSRPLAATNACLGDVCYVDGATTPACNGRGACVGDVSECKGTCASSSDCYAVLPFDTNYWYSMVGTDKMYVSGGLLAQMLTCGPSYFCEFGVCTATLNVIEYGFDESALSTAGSGANGCISYLNQTFARPVSEGGQGGAACLVVERYNIPHDLAIEPLTDDLGNLYFEDNIPYGQVAMCTYKYACSSMNYDMVLSAWQDSVQPM